MLFMLFLVLLNSSARQGGLSPMTLNQFGASAATPILRPEALPPHAGRVAERMASYARNRAPALVSEDGAAVAVRVGTIYKIDIEQGRLLADSDRYTIRIDGGKVLAYNASQSAYIGSGSKEARTVGLIPVALLDKHRTLCVESTVVYGPPRQYFLNLALIDERQRGPSPNRARRVAVPHGLISGAGVSVARIDGDWYTMQVGGVERHYIDVNIRTLETRASQPLRLNELENPPKDITAGLPVRFSPARRVGWDGKVYYILYTGEAYVWDGTRLERTDPFTIVAASRNGKYAWLMNREAGRSWLLSK